MWIATLSAVWGEEKAVSETRKTGNVEDEAVGSSAVPLLFVFHGRHYWYHRSEVRAMTQIMPWLHRTLPHDTLI